MNTANTTAALFCLGLIACGDDTSTSSGGGGSGGTGATSATGGGSTSSGGPCIPHVLADGEDEVTCADRGCDLVSSNGDGSVRFCTLDCSSEDPECPLDHVCRVNAFDSGICIANCFDGECEPGLECRDSACVVP